MKWIRTKERRWTEAEREAGIWVWDGFVPLWTHPPNEKPWRLPRLSECNPRMMLKTQTGAYCSHWMLAESDEPPVPPERPPEYPMPVIVDLSKWDVSQRGAIPVVVLWVLGALAASQLVPNWRISALFAKKPPTAALDLAQREAAQAKLEPPSIGLIALLH